MASWAVAACVLVSVANAQTAHYRVPAGTLPAVSRASAPSILPGGRVITPLGVQFRTGPGPFGLAVNPRGDLFVSADGGPNRYGLTVVTRDKDQWHVRRHQAARENEPAENDPDWRSVFMGIAFRDRWDVFASEGESGRVRLMDVREGHRKALFDLNQGGFADSYSGDLAFDAATNRLYVVDQANFRVAIFDARSRKLLGSVKTGRLPFALALAPDGKSLWVTHVGVFEYQPLPRADTKLPRETGLLFPAFGFPSRESAEGVTRETQKGPVQIPPLGDPNSPLANSVAVVDVSDPANAKVEAHIRTGLPFGRGIEGGSSPSGILVAADRVFVSNANQDTITVIDAASRRAVKDIALRIPGLDQLRGVLPIGLAFDAATGWVLVAEAGINAVGVIDTRTLEVLGHIPAPWFPTRIVTRDGRVYVCSAKGRGTGPNATRTGPMQRSFQGEFRQGSVSVFGLPDTADLAKMTEQVLANNGFVPSKEPPRPLPAAIEHIVIIVKENRTFDEVFGDYEQASNGPVAGIPDLARFGKRGWVNQRRGELKQRLGLRNINITPNHHALAERFAFSANFYADSEVSVDGHHWIVGSYPNAWTESTLMAAYGGQKEFRLPSTAPGRLQFPESNSSVHPEDLLEAGTLWHHLERHKITFRNYGEGFELAGSDEGAGLKPTGAAFLTNVPMPDPLYRNTSRTYPGYNTNIPDQYRATEFIRDVEELYLKPRKPLPRLLFLHLPNDHMAAPRPEDGYPFEASYVADNDVALGRIVEFLSGTEYWKKMAIFVTEDDAQGGVDHIDSHRTVLLAISPWTKRFYASKINSSFPGILKTAFRLLRIPPLNLYDAAAADLADCFDTTPDFTPYKMIPVAPELFDPAAARDPLDPKPGPRMDDPSVLREQHRRQ